MTRAHLGLSVLLVLFAWLLFEGPSMTAPEPPRVKRVLFVCIHNSNRSQMAEAFARLYGGDGVEAYSAGSAPSGKVNPRAIEFMAELSYDLRTHRSKSVHDVPQVDYDAIITMGCGDACPNLKARVQADWGIRDPKDLPPEEYRQVRDQIAARVRGLLHELGVSSAAAPAQ